MSLASGTLLGSYEVLSLLGAGGMGEVYRARDRKLQRDVAIKILPGAFATDPDRLARFEREAQVLASLNHPNIAAIYGLEAGALVLELVEGPTLADRIAQGPIPIDEALPIARQMAEALEAAHEQGIVHRDLKPANIKLRPDGTVKVLDFGLAKLSDRNGSNPSNVSNGFSMSPTITSPAMMTGVGVLLGTAAYMSPEQAKGKPADKRSDVWAFGCVVYEMLTARHAFDGADATEVIAAVIRGEPDWTRLPADVPPAVRALLADCLEKDPRRRASDAAVARFAIDHSRDVAPTARSRGRWKWIVAPVGAVVLIAAGMAIARVAARDAARSAPVLRFTIDTPEPAALTPLSVDRDLVLTPDGSRIVYRGNDALFVRTLDQLVPIELVRVNQTRGVFASPDGEWVGFFEGNDLMKKVRITGGPATTITAVEGSGPRGATWGPDGTIVYAINSAGAGLRRVSASGGTPVVITKPDLERGETGHLWPEFLPDGTGVLYTINIGNVPADYRIALLDLATGDSRTLIDAASHAHYVPTGHIVYGVPGGLRAVRFDLDRREVVGESVPVLEDMATTDRGAAEFTFANTGSMAYISDPGRFSSVVAFDRTGRITEIPGVRPDLYQTVRVSPDGRRLALATPTDIWVYDFERATTTRLTTNPAADTRPLWTPDGQRIVFTSRRSVYPTLYWTSADGSGEETLLLDRGNQLADLRGIGWSPNGKLLIAEVPGGRNAVWELDVAKPSEARPLLRREYSSDWATVSPDGRWIAYIANPSGRMEVYVERYPQLGARQQISTDGGTRPRWSRDGRELFYVTADGRQMMRVAVDSRATLRAGQPQMLFDPEMAAVQGGTAPFDVMPDGRLIAVRPATGLKASGIVFVHNWFEELKARVPVN